MTNNSPSTHKRDLSVDQFSDALQGVLLDVIISGSIAAVESVKFIRALRRLGAEVVPWLTPGGSMFVTPMALEWASNNKVQSEFTGTASHLSVGDACVVAPASANIIQKICYGVADTPAPTLVASYLGMGKKVMFMPAMHDSLYESPKINENIQNLSKIATCIQPRISEGKKKFPNPEQLADEVSHIVNSNGRDVMVTMGSTKGYLDEVRYISNYSSGALGSAISAEFYRQGFNTHVVCANATIRPSSYSKLYDVSSNNDMSEIISKLNYDAAVMAASVLDFVPKNTQAGKIKSSSTSELNIALIRDKKIIKDVHPSSGVKVGFKLETDPHNKDIIKTIHKYFDEYGLSLLVLNYLNDVDKNSHKAFVFTKEDCKTDANPTVLSSKQQIAEFIVSHTKQIIG